MNSRNEFEGRRRLYRARDGWGFGVIQGLADYAGLSVFWLRVIVVVFTVLSGIGVFVAPVLYAAGAVIMPPTPVLEPTTEDDLEFYHAYASSRSMGLSRLKRRLESLEGRTRRMESVVTAREFDWERRLKA